METQLQDVLSLWENAASEARSESAAEVAELRKQARPASAAPARAPPATQQRSSGAAAAAPEAPTRPRWSSCRRS
jgi:hypothetical protein